MIPRQDPAKSYRKITTQTASPGHLVLMLYDGALAYLEKGLKGFDYTDPAESNSTISNNVLRAQAIIYDMNARLSMEAGGEVAENFRRLYCYYHRRLQEGNIKKKKSLIIEVAGHLRVLRDAWAEMLRRGGTEGEGAAEGGLNLSRA